MYVHFLEKLFAQIREIDKVSSLQRLVGTMDDGFITYKKGEYG